MNKSDQERLIQLEDDLAIKALAAKFADVVTIGDHEGLRTVWKPGAVFTINEPNYTTRTGIDEIGTLIKQLRDNKNFFVQFVHTGVIKIEGNKASARWIMHEVGQGPGEKFYNNYGVFNDIMEKIDGTWFFVSRSYDYMWLDTEPFSGQSFALPSQPQL